MTEGNLINHLELKSQIMAWCFDPKPNGGFRLPPELLADENVNLRFISGKHDLYFANIPLKRFNDIIIGVDNKPFEEGNLPQKASP